MQHKDVTILQHSSVNTLEISCIKNNMTEYSWLQIFKISLNMTDWFSY